VRRHHRLGRHAAGSLAEADLLSARPPAWPEARQRLVQRPDREELALAVRGRHR
jgi:hypothetical protein